LPKRFNNNVILFVSDFHAPYHHHKTLDFLSRIKDQFRPDRIVHGGDHADCYSVSDYPKSLEHPDTWTTELKGIRKFTKDLAEIFPDIEMLESNHDSRLYKKARVAGVPRECLVKYLDMINAPPGWRLHSQLDLTVDADRSSWKFVHTINNGAFGAAKNLGVSVCSGHHHSKSGFQSFNNGKKVIYGVDSGSFISDKGHPYSYNKLDIGRPIRSCVIIIEGKPQMIMME